MPRKIKEQKRETSLIPGQWVEVPTDTRNSVAKGTVFVSVGRLKILPAGKEWCGSMTTPQPELEGFLAAALRASLAETEDHMASVGGT